MCPGGNCHTTARLCWQEAVPRGASAQQPSCALNPGRSLLPAWECAASWCPVSCPSFLRPGCHPSTSGFCSRASAGSSRPGLQGSKFLRLPAPPCKCSGFLSSAASPLCVSDLLTGPAGRQRGGREQGREETSGRWPGRVTSGSRAAAVQAWCHPLPLQALAPQPGPENHTEPEASLSLGLRGCREGVRPRVTARAAPAGEDVASGFQLSLSIVRQGGPGLRTEVCRTVLGERDRRDTAKRCLGARAASRTVRTNSFFVFYKVHQWYSVPSSVVCRWGKGRHQRSAECGSLHTAVPQLPSPPTLRNTRKHRAALQGSGRDTWRAGWGGSVRGLL